MQKNAAKDCYERILMLRLQLFLRVTAFAGTLLIFGTYERKIMEKPLAHLGLQESYAAALLIAFSVSAATATMDLPIRYIIRRIRGLRSRKST